MNATREIIQQLKHHQVSMSKIIIDSNGCDDLRDLGEMVEDLGHELSAISFAMEHDTDVDGDDGEED